MSEAPATSYDEIPYGNYIFYYSHPNRLATMATLLGLEPPPVGRCRVLELGCGTGVNLLNMALTLPGSRFVGLDLSPRQIAMGQELTQKLGLTNIRLEAKSLLEVDEHFGQFDYIICHGVYSWVPRPVQDKILTICKQNLSPSGVAYVSYNTYPGWHLRGMFREMMRYHVAQFPEPEVRIQQARALLDFLREATGERKSVYSELLKVESDMLARADDAYLYHEHLEEVNHPLYFHEFAELAAAKGLQYLAEAQPTPLPASLSPQVTKTMEQLAVDLIHGEQYLDFVRNRTFRRSLLCHTAAAVQRPAAPEKVLAMHLTALLKPISAQPDLGATTAEEFRTVEGVSLTSRDPLLKAALTSLFDVWPQSIPFADLCAMTQTRLNQAGEAGATARGQDPLPLADRMMQCFLSNLVELHVHPPRFATSPGERPVASPLARLQSESGSLLANLRHRTSEPGEFERQLLRYLDGSRDRTAILNELVDAMGRGDMELQRDGQPLNDLEVGRQLLGESLEPSLRQLARNALLMA